MLEIKLNLLSEETPPKTGEHFFAYYKKDNDVHCYRCTWDAKDNRFTGAFCQDGTSPGFIAWSPIPTLEA